MEARIQASSVAGIVESKMDGVNGVVDSISEESNKDLVAAESLG